MCVKVRESVFGRTQRGGGDSAFGVSSGGRSVDIAQRPEESFLSAALSLQEAPVLPCLCSTFLVLCVSYLDSIVLVTVASSLTTRFFCAIIGHLTLTWNRSREWQWMQLYFPSIIPWMVSQRIPFAGGYDGGGDLSWVSFWARECGFLFLLASVAHWAVAAMGADVGASPTIFFPSSSPT